MAQMSLRDATIFIGGAAGIEVAIGDGNVTWTENRPLKYTTEGVVIDDVVEDIEQPLDVTFAFTWKRATATPIQLIQKIKGTPALTSSDTSDPCRPYAVDIYIKMQITCDATPDYRQITLPDFRYETLEYDLSAGTISATGKCNVLRADPSTTV